MKQIKRSAGQSAVAAAAYRAGERLYSDYYGEYSDYTRKGGVIHSEILLPPNAPPEYRDRATLWNAVEHAERHKKAQLAYSFDIALQNELTMEENICSGGFGEHVSAWYAREGILVRQLNISLPDAFVEHGKPEELCGLGGIDAASAAEKIRSCS